MFPFLFYLFHRKEKLGRCLILNAKIHYSHHLKSMESSEDTETNPTSNEVIVSLKSSENKYRRYGCLKLHQEMRFMRAVVSFFSEMLALPHRVHETSPNLKPILPPNGDVQVLPAVPSSEDTTPAEYQATTLEP